MADNVLQTLQRLVQDVIAPDVRELKVRMSSLEKLMDERFKSTDDKVLSLEKSMDAKFKLVDEKFRSIDERFTSLEKQSEAQFKAILAAISDSRAQTQLAFFRDISALSERVTALKARMPKQ